MELIISLFVFLLERLLVKDNNSNNNIYYEKKIINSDYFLKFF
jgi:hypothetical protein